MSFDTPSGTPDRLGAAAPGAQAAAPAIVRFAPRPGDDSEAIKSRIEAALQQRANEDAREIRVAVSGNKVVLTGNVRSWALRDAFRAAAWAALGVGEVTDRLRISY